MEKTKNGIIISIIVSSSSSSDRHSEWRVHALTNTCFHFAILTQGKHSQVTLTHRRGGQADSHCLTQNGGHTHSRFLKQKRKQSHSQSHKEYKAPLSLCLSRHTRSLSDTQSGGRTRTLLRTRSGGLTLTLFHVVTLSHTD